MLLAIETVHDICSVCLYDNDQLIAIETEHAPRKQTQRILPMIDAIFSSQQLGFSDITAIAFNRGPGSFSGIRINTAVAQALAFAHDIPCVPVSGLHAQAQAVFQRCPDLSHVTVINDAKMSEVFVATFRNESGKAVLQGEERLLPLDYDFQEEARYPVTGDGVALVHLEKRQGTVVVAADAEQPYPLNAEHIALLAWQAVMRKEAVLAKDAQPVYLRNKAWKTLTEQAQARAEKRAATNASAGIS